MLYYGLFIWIIWSFQVISDLVTACSAKALTRLHRPKPGPQVQLHAISCHCHVWCCAGRAQHHGSCKWPVFFDVRGPCRSIFGHLPAVPRFNAACTGLYIHTSKSSHLPNANVGEGDWSDAMLWAGWHRMAGWQWTGTCTIRTAQGGESLSVRHCTIKSSRSWKIMEDLDMFTRVTRLHGKNGIGNPDMATKVCAFSRAVISWSKSRLVVASFSCTSGLASCSWKFRALNFVSHTVSLLLCWCCCKAGFLAENRPEPQGNRNTMSPTTVLTGTTFLLKQLQQANPKKPLHALGHRRYQCRPHAQKKTQQTGLGWPKTNRTSNYELYSGHCVVDFFDLFWPLYL